MAVTSDGEEISSNATKTDGFQPSEKHCELEEQGENGKSIPEDADCDTRIQDQKPADRTGIHPIFPMKNMAHLPSSYTLNTDHTEAEEQHRNARDIAPSALSQRRHWHTVDDRSEPVRCALMTPVNLEENVSPPTPAEIMELLDTKKNGDWDAMYEALPEEMQFCESDLTKRDLHITPEIDLTDEEGYTPVYKAAVKGHLEIVDDLTSYGANLDKPSNGGLTPLHAAAQEGHGAIVDYLILQGADVNTECDLGQTSLHKAASHGNADIVASFIVEGCDVNKCDGKGQTPLHAAAAEGHTDIIISLIQAGAILNRRDARGSTPLLTAIHSAHNSSVRALVSMGADASEENTNGDIPLHSAAAAGHKDIVKYLIEQGSDKNKKNNIGRTSLHLAVRHGHIEVVTYLLLTGTEVTKLDGKTLLYTAAQFGHLDIIEWLIINGADVNEEDGKGMIPLHGAAINGNIEVLEYLIQKGSDVNKSDVTGWTPFNAAVEFGHLEAVKYLIGNGARQNNYRGNDPLYTAVRHGHLELSKFFISSGSDVNEENNKGRIPLHSAAFRDHRRIMEYLIQQGSDVNKSDGQGWTPFHAAIQSGHLEAVQYLMANGAKQKRYAGMTPLYSAAQSGHVNIVEFLISKGADVNEGNNKGLIPLHGAAARGHMKVMECLIKEGSDVNKSDAKGWTPLNAAIQSGHLEAVKYLMANGAKQNRYTGMTPLFAAAQSGHLHMVRFFISEQADVNKEDEVGQIPLHGAASGGHLEVMEYLIQQGSDVNIGDCKGWTPFNAAVQYGHLEAAKYLMANGAKQNRYDSMTPPYFAAQAGHLNMVRLFVSNEADVNEEDEEGMVPLHGAAAGGHIEVIEFLLEQGSDVNKRNNKGWTPFNAAVQYGHLEAVKYLISKGAEQNRYHEVTPLYAASRLGHIDLVKFFISNGSHVNEENDSGRIPLHGAATRGHMEVMEYLIQQGADVNGCDSKGWTPFNAAVRNGHLEAVKLLMAKGARGTSFHGMTSVYIATQYDNIAVAKHLVSTGYDVNERSECGRSPLHAACYNGNIDAVRFLVGHNANVNEQDQDGWTPLHIAAEEGNRELVAFLIMNGADIDEKGIFGMTPLQVAQNAGHANVIDGISVCEDGTTSGYILLKDTDTQLCLRGPPLQSIAPSCDARLSTQVDKLEDESDYEISEKGNEISSKYHSAMAFDGEKCYNEADNPFVYAKAECLDKTVQDAKVHQNEAPEDPIPWERRSRLERLVTSPPEQFDALPSSTYNIAGSFLRGPLVIDGMDLNGFDPLFPHTPTVEENGLFNEETESSCQTPGETTNDIKGPSSGLATGQDDQEKDSPDVCKRPLSTRALTFAQEELCEDCVENGAFARLMEERKTIYRSTCSRNHSLLPVVQAALTLLLLPWNSLLVGATGSHKEVELQAGTSGTIPFHVSWPQDDSSHVFPYFTLRFASMERPFCINGMPDPQGFEYSSQYFKFTTIKYETSSSLSVNLTISNVNALDGTSYVYTVHLYERKEPWSGKMAIKARVVPGPAKCAITTTGYSPNLYEAYCNASSGDDGTTITCYQDNEKIPFKHEVRTNGLVTRGVFWVQKDKALFCCSHYISDEPNQQTCHDFVWYPVETHIPDISNSSLVTEAVVSHHPEVIATFSSSSVISPYDSTSPSERNIQNIVSVLIISVLTLILAK